MRRKNHGSEDPQAGTEIQPGSPHEQNEANHRLLSVSGARSDQKGCV
jgi:hypothetical protein